MWTAVLPPGESKPTFRALKTPSPAGGADWCAMHPVLRGHPKTFDAIVLGWLEGGGDQSSCAVSATGGQARVALLGLNGPDAAVSVPAKCPSGNNQPSRGRGDMWLLQAGPQSNKQDAAQLGGLLVRPGPTGALAFNGNVVGDWGGGSAQALPSAQLAGYTEAPTSARPVMAAWTTGATILVPSAFKSATKEALPALTALKVDTAGKPATKRSVLLTNVALSCDKPEFLSVEARYDPDVKRIGALISGTCETTSVHRGFLAFARVHPDQGVASGPKVAILHDVPKAVSAPAAIEAFRLAQLPNSTHFLAAWSAPGTAVIKAFRIEPKDDLTFKAVDLGAIAGNFAGKAGSVPGASNGGLSELIIAPDGDRYSLAWEGVGALHLLTATIPQ